jgi:hypothetical protein
MGDNFEVVVDVEATLDEAPRLGRTMIAWLTVEGIIDASPTDDRDVWGAGHYLPGRNRQLTAALADDPYTRAFAQSRLGRLEVTTGRAVFYPIQGEPGPAVCPLCGYSVALMDPETGEMTDDWQLFGNALADWHDGGPGTVTCPNNGSAIAINEWQWQGNWPIAVGHLGLTFWNWPLLHPNFVGRIGDRLGHRVVTTRGKL